MRLSWYNMTLSEIGLLIAAIKIALCNMVLIFWVCVCFDVMYSGEHNVFDVTPSVYPHQAGWKVSLTTVGIEPATFGILVQCSANWATRPSLFECVVFWN